MNQKTTSLCKENANIIASGSVSETISPNEDFRSSQYLGKSYVMVGAGSGLGSIMGLLEEMTLVNQTNAGFSTHIWVSGCRVDILLDIWAKSSPGSF